LEDAEFHVVDHAENRVVGVAALLRRLRESRGAVPHRHGGERYGRERQRNRHHRDDDGSHGLRDRLAVVAGLLGHIGDRVDAGEGDHSNRDRDEEVADRRRGPEVDVLDERLGGQHEHDAEHHEADLGDEVGERQDDVQARGLLHPEHVHGSEEQHDADADEDVLRRCEQRLPDDPEVVRQEERRDGDRDDVVEHLAPRGQHRPELVERLPREGGGAAGLRVHRGRLGVRERREDEDHAGDREHDGCHAEGEHRHEAERVVDRAAYVAVRGREQRACPEHALEATVLGAVLGHPTAER
jgi:hypothetical protein